jgi:Ca-activated chloride channel family protein
MGKYAIISLCLIGSLLVISNLGYADGFIIPIRPPNVVRVPPLAIKYHRVSVEIGDQVALTKVDQVFVNEFHRDLEGTYIFPLPKGANITEFAMYINGERVSGELLESGKARKIYQDIVNQMKDPALLEYFDRDMFKIRVYPIPAHGEKRIQLEYSELLKSDAGLVRYYYPLDTEKFSSRPLEEISVAVTINSQQPMKSIYSPSHEVVIDRKGDHKATVSFEDSNIVPDKDFVLYYAVSEKTFGANLLTYKKTRQDGYFMLMLSPGYEVKEQQVLPKDIVFVLDTSGSMRRDNKLKQAQDALIYGIEGLHADDRFGIVAFSTTVNTFDDVLQEGSKQNIENAVEFVKQLQARGGTDIYEALKTALELLDEDSNHPKIVVFLTDGRPTVGLTDYSDILKKVRENNSQRNRIFTYGVGYDVNTHLLDALAEESKAASAYIEPQEDLEVIVSSFFDKIDSPVLSNIELKIEGAGAYDLFPKELPDLFKGSQLLLLGQYRNPEKAELVLTGMVNGEEESYRYGVDFPQTDLANDFLPRIWASRKIGYLLDQIRLHGEDRELKEEVIELAKKFGIVTPYTSYLVTEDEEINVHRRQGWRMPFRDLSATPAESAGHPRSTQRKAADEMYRLGTEEAPAPALPPGFTETKEGEVAVRVSKDVENLKQQIVVSDAISREIRYLGTKTFYFINQVWIDSEYVEGKKTVKIAYGSEAYFKLLDAKPEVGKYLSLGEKVILCWNDQLCLEIGSEGIREADNSQLLDVLRRLD